MSQDPIALTDDERRELAKTLETVDHAEFKQTMRSVAEAISMLIRAMDGKPIEYEDMITRLTNVKNVLERSRFPTYSLLAKQVYLRLLAKAGGEEAKPYLDWANPEAEALISYKGLSRVEWTEQLKAASGNQEQTQFYLGEQGRTPYGPPKHRFWQRPPKEEPSEFVSQ